MPDLLVLGQVTVDHAVPATPGPWRESLGGNALYAAAGARLFCDPGRVGVVTRLGRGLGEDVRAMLGRAGLPAGGLTEVDVEPLVEWHLYERDGSRRSVPRNAALRDPAADVATLRQRYLAHLERLSPTAGDIPRAWLPARAAHVAPQVAARHGATVPWLAGARGLGRRRPVAALRPAAEGRRARGHAWQGPRLPAEPRRGRAPRARPGLEGARRAAARGGLRGGGRQAGGRRLSRGRARLRRRRARSPRRPRPSST